MGPMKAPLRIWRSYTSNDRSAKDIQTMIREEHQKMLPLVQQQHSQLLKDCMEEAQRREADKKKVFPYSVTWLCHLADKDLRKAGKTDPSMNEVEAAIVNRSAELAVVDDPNNDDYRILV